MEWGAANIRNHKAGVYKAYWFNRRKYTQPYSQNFKLVSTIFSSDPGNRANFFGVGFSKQQRNRNNWKAESFRNPRIKANWPMGGEDIVVLLFCKSDPWSHFTIHQAAEKNISLPSKQINRKLSSFYTTSILRIDVLLSWLMEQQ